MQRRSQELIDLRNALAHGNYITTLKAFGENTQPEDAALKYYNAVVDAVMLINVGTGSDTRPLREIRAYFEPLKVRSSAPAAGHG